MNIKKYFFFLAFLLGLQLPLESLAQCELFDLIITKSDCNQNNKFAVKINFGHRETSDCFTIHGNGVNYGTFFYSNLPVIIDGLKGDCSTIYEFEIIDCNNNHCTVGKELGKVCCPNLPDCKLYDLRYEKTECDSNKQFYVYVNFNHLNTSSCFKVDKNDHFYGEFDYSKLPLKLGPFEADCATIRNFKFYDCKNPDCKIGFELQKVCCEDTCKISNIRIEKTHCDSNNMFNVFIGFKAQGVSDSFFIKGNGKIYGKFKYGSPNYKIGPLPGDCTTKYGFLIIDHKNFSCAADTNIGIVCCDTLQKLCKLSELRVEKTDCNPDKLFYVVLDFDHQNTSDCFKVTGNGHDYGTFPYASLPLKLGPFKGDCTTEYEFSIEDCKDPHCSIGKSIGTVCCEPNTEPCKLAELNIEKTDCNADKLFYVVINFIHKNTGDCFKVTGNGHEYGTFTYASLPLKLGPFKGDCTTEYEFNIVDCKDPNCSIGKSIGTVCCEPNPTPCLLSELVFEKTDCDANKQFYVFFKFKYSNTSECFRVTVNNDVLGEFKYTSLPVKLGPFNGDCKTDYHFLIQDCKDPHCALEKLVERVCCEPGTEPCKLYDLRAERTDCDANKEFYVYFASLKTKNASECFRIRGNGHDYGEFLYSSLPIKLGPFKGDCQTNYEFVLIDCKDPHCAIEYVPGIVCCDGDCKLSELKISKTDCLSERKFFAILNFVYHGTSDCFRVKGNGHDYGTYKYSQLPIKIGPLLADCNTNYEFAIFDCEKERCSVSGVLGKVCCEPHDAKFYDVLMTRSDCEPDSTFKVKFDFKYRNVSDSFLFSINGIYQKTYSYQQIPISIGPIKADCKTIYKFLFIDKKDSTIRLERFIERPCCRPKAEPCKIFDIKATPLHCTGPDEYALMINFKTQGITNAYFEVYSRQGNIGFFPFSQLPITINNFKKSGKDFDFIKICENDNDACCTSIEFHTIDCITTDPKKFSISRVLVNNSATTVSIFSELEIPDGVEVELFNLEGRKIEVDKLESGPHEILISTENLSTNIYFIRLKNLEFVETYKFFHIR